MEFGVNLPNMGVLATPENLRILAIRAEELGFDHLWISDHVIYAENITSYYPYNPSSPHVDPEVTYLEPLSVLCYLAGCTQRIKLGPHVLILPYRNPVLAAKMIATLDYLSAGRVILGVGVGWMEEEFVALGQDTFSQRGKVSDEYIRIFKELWTKDDPEYQGDYYQFSGFKFYPKPVQKPYPPIWVGGHSPGALRRAARLGDGWLPAGTRPPSDLEPEEMGGLITELRGMTEKAGRPREAVEVMFSGNLFFDPPQGHPGGILTGTTDKIVADIAQYQQVGVQHFLFSFAWREEDGRPYSSQAHSAGEGKLERMLESMERFAKEVKPQVV